MTGTRGSRPGGDEARPRLANPYDLGTWSAAGASASSAPSAADAPTPQEPEPRPHSESAPGSASAGQLAPGAPAPTHQAWPQPRGPRPGVERGASAEELFDPPELEASADPFELARRTVNRSRAAARDRGLFPISAKTQARDARDRSGRAPGYSGSRPDPRDPQGIENVLKKVLGNLGWNAGMSAGRVLEEWDDIVGERIATHCRPVSFEDGVLVVSASSSAWAAQLRMLSPQLITTIEERVGSHVISELTVTGPAAAQRTWKKGRRTVTWRGPRDTYG